MKNKHILFCVCLFFYCLLMETNFSSFTNFYPISKTLRFELKPIGATKRLLQGENPFKKDKIIDEVYHNIIKPKLDILHRKFIEESLKGFQTQLLSDDLDYIYETNKKIFEELQKKLAKEIVKHMNSQKIILEKDGKTIEIAGTKNLWDKKILDILAEYFGDEIYEETEFEEIKGKTIKEIIEKYFKGFFTYLKTFNENRKNFYKDDLKFGRVATRIVKDNLPKFLENIIAYEKFNYKISLNDEEKEIFNIQNFIEYLNQSGIDTYNKIIGKINSKINEYNQKNNLKGKNKIKSLQILYKQILGESEKQDIFNFAITSFKKDSEVLEALKNFIKKEEELSISSVKKIIDNFDDFDLGGIWIKKGNLKKLSNNYLKNWGVLESLLPKTDEEGKNIGIDDVVSLEQVKEALDNAKTDEEIFKEKDVLGKTNFEKFIKLFLGELKSLENQKQEKIVKLNNEVFNKDFEKSKEQKQAIKDYLDIVLEIERKLNLFSLIKGQGENKEEIQVENKDNDFYNAIGEYLELEVFKFYNAIRNYLTKKPWSKEKIKINFNSPTLLDGWDKNKEIQNFAIVLRKYDNERQDYDYFLAIMKKGSHYIFDENKNPGIYNVNQDFFEKMEYKLLPGPNKMLPKVFFSKSRIKEFSPSERILEIRKNETFKQGNNFDIEDLHRWIDFMKQSLEKHPEWKEFGFKFKETKDYNNIKDFYADVEKQGYKLTFKNVDFDKVLDLVENDKLYLFQIYNKDFSKYSKGKQNLHTIYWKSIFDKNNFVGDFSPVFKLNGEAEIFFREKSEIPEKKRKLKDGVEILEKKRYLEHKILFHVPITLNFVNKGIKKVNDEVKNYIKENKMKVIGIDRGEKHLLYVSLIDENGNKIKSESLNCILNKMPSGEEKEICYIDKLIKKEKSRDNERKSWDDIETIKELKEGYISQIVNYLVDLAVKENAIIVLEDLNGGFKRSRQKIERQIYQKLEAALAKKLNYVVFKDRGENELGGNFKAYQLTPPVNDYQDIRSQTGILFFTQAAYTSTTCPSCGFRKNIYPKYDNMSKALEFIKSLDIEYKNGNFYFSYKIEKRKDKKGNALKLTNFTIFTKFQERIKISRSKDNKKIEKISYNMQEFFKNLFEKNNLDLENLKESIEKNKSLLDSNFFKSFIFGFNLLLQLRNSDSEENLDYIQCPRCEFDSRKSDFITNGDENGAYNIARRGKMIIDKIRKEDDKIGITLVEWDNEVLN